MNTKSNAASSGGWHQRLVRHLRILLTPSYWMQNNPYSPEWDARLKELMAEHKFETDTWATVKLGNCTIWIANHPYASFSPSAPMKMDIRPSRRTIFEAHQKMIRDIYA